VAEEQALVGLTGYRQRKEPFPRSNALLLPHWYMADTGLYALTAAVERRIS